MDWDKLRIFHAVAEAGSFTHAGEVLNLSQSAVSRQISALEESLKVSLFHRHARGLILTEQGELLFRTAHDVFAKLAMAEAMLADSKDKPRGELRVTTTVSFGMLWLTPRIKEFADLYPDIRVHLILDDDELDLGMREADIAIRFRAPVQADLVQRRLVQVTNHLYAAPSYIKRHGAPKSIEDLDNHAILVYGAAVPQPLADVNWLLNKTADLSKQRKPIFTVNNIYALMLAVESGLGVAALPDYVARGNTKLTQVLPDYAGPTFDTYFVYPEELRDTKRIAVFRDFMLRKVAEWGF
ncbi:LysR family transcriptional regulator [Oleomonas cavernae]|uniref:LysR family transcriptional regulator n=1 Tax=Oleomonas cavernae TaxID=2320859 RepID=A0A418WIY5_9PROT|nr:LysR family transcriptional regulator [Oleomonas cavernae]RJF90021.1 LysR family transcriptional regulator [Oleomonas cavernae]